MRRFRLAMAAMVLGLGFGGGGTVSASSHREAPFITEHPKTDGTDFYMFRSYETGIGGSFVTLIANYVPLQDPYGGPNYFFLDPEALYEIHVDNNHDAVEDLTFQFRFTNTFKNTQLNIGGTNVSIPLINFGAIGPGVADTANLNVTESYTLKLIRGDRRTGTVQTITNANTGASTFVKPVDNIGNKSFANYAGYSNAHIFPITIPGCAGNGRVFVGQRQEPFYVNLGETFDLVNIAAPVGEANANAEVNTIQTKNVTSLALEIPTDCLLSGDPVIGGWTTASLRQGRVINPAPSFAAGKTATVEGGAWTQVSRLGNPLVNEVVIGIVDKDRFNHAEPKDDGQFLTYVTNPTLPALLKVLFPALPDPAATPRTDLVEIFLTGKNYGPVTNRPTSASAVPCEVLRLNTSTPPTARGAQNALGVAGGDVAGFPNGRRPGDDVVDVALRAAYGLLASPAVAVDFVDGVRRAATDYPDAFPYLNTALPGSPGN